MSIKDHSKLTASLPCRPKDLVLATITTTTTPELQHPQSDEPMGGRSSRTRALPTIFGNCLLSSAASDWVTRQKEGTKTKRDRRSREGKSQLGKDKEMKREAKRRRKTTKGALTGGSNSETTRSRSKRATV